MSAPTASVLRRTALFEAHRRWGARLVEFGGWEMPVFYSSILDEHQAVRKQAGLFDISHMGEFWIEGPNAAEFLNELLTNDIARLEVGDGQYTLLLNERGGVIDDLIIYRVAAESFLLVVNAAKIEEDRKWIEGRITTCGISFRDESDELAAVALQGPHAAEILTALNLPGVLPERNGIVPQTWNGHSLRIARTGYTGEDGFELFLSVGAVDALWEELLAKGKSFGLKPAGLGCRDTLRLEACYPLNGNDLSPERTPLEAGLGTFVALGKAADFPGKAILIRQKQAGVPSKLTALRPVEKSAPPRAHYQLFAEGKPVGEITSGTLSPTLGHGIALGYVETAFAKPGQVLQMEVRGQRIPLEVVTKPFYKKL